MSEAACSEISCGRTVSPAETSDFDVSECEYRPRHRIPEHGHDRATFCVVLDGASEEHGASEALRTQGTQHRRHLSRCPTEVAYLSER